MANWFLSSSNFLNFLSPNPLCCLKTVPFFTNTPTLPTHAHRTHSNALLCTVTIFTRMHVMVFNWFVHAMFSHLKLFWQAFEAKKNQRRQRQQQRRRLQKHRVLTINHIIEILIVNHLQRSTHWLNVQYTHFDFIIFSPHPFPRTNHAINMNYLAHTHTHAQP